MRLLLVEDEKEVSRHIVKIPNAERFAVDVAADGARGLELAGTYDCDLIILDLMLLGLSGTDALRQIRERDVHVPVLILTARDAVGDKVRHFEIGALEYLMASAGRAVSRAMIIEHVWDQSFDGT